LKNLVANVLVTDNASGQYRNYKFDNIVVPNGQLSVHYLFPDVGLYEVVTRISAKDIAALLCIFFSFRCLLFLCLVPI
jgi:hypothetical protein